MGRAGKQLLFAVVTFVVFLLAVEALLRVTHLFGARLSGAEPHPTLAYRFTPGREYWMLEENDHPVSGRYNSLGWRDRERTVEKPPGSYRLAVLGDSQVEAANVELDSTFCSLAERALNAGGSRRYEVLNFGRSGFTQTEELWLLENEILRYSPDALLLLFLPANDIADVRRETAPNRMRPFYRVAEDGSLELDTSFRKMREYRVKAFVDPLKKRSILLSLALQRYNLFRATRRSAPAVQLDDPASGISGALTLYTDRPDPRFQESFRLNRMLLARIAEVCRDHGVDFALAVCNWNYRREDVERLRRIDPSFDPNRVEDELRALADSLGAPFLGLQSAFARHHEETGEPLNWIHWNYAGQRFVAERVEALVRELDAPRVPGGGLEPPRDLPSGF